MFFFNSKRSLNSWNMDIFLIINYKKIVNEYLKILNYGEDAVD